MHVSIYLGTFAIVMVLSMGRWVGKVAVVTGASSGIGKAISESLVVHGLKVVGLATRKDCLDKIATNLEAKKGRFFPIKTDISKEEDILNAFRWIKDNLGPIHILINNAAVIRWAHLIQGETQDWQDTFQVNVIGLSVATREVVKDMRTNKIDGHIIHINSISGQQVLGLPTTNVYSASKFAVRALAETLRLELNALKSRIKITNLSPGLVDTEFIPEFLRNGNQIEEGKLIEPEQIADSVIYVLSTPPHVQIQELIVRPILDFETSGV